MFVSDRRWPQLGWPARGPWLTLSLLQRIFRMLVVPISWGGPPGC